MPRDVLLIAAATLAALLLDLGVGAALLRRDRRHARLLPRPRPLHLFKAGRHVAARAVAQHARGATT